MTTTPSSITSDNMSFTALRVEAGGGVTTASNLGVALNGGVPFSVDAWVNLDGYEFLRRYAIPDEPGAYIDSFQQNSDPAKRIAITVRWCPSVEAAHERLVDYLLHCMNPVVPRLADSDIHLGDLGFGGNPEGSAGLIFSRGNVVIRVDSIGEKPAPVTSFACAFDVQMITKMAVLK